MTAREKVLAIVSKLSDLIPPSQRGFVFPDATELLGRISAEEIDTYYYWLIEEPIIYRHKLRAQALSDELLAELQQRARRTYQKYWRFKGGKLNV